jgi:hypothetical protein
LIETGTVSMTALRAQEKALASEQVLVVLQVCSLDLACWRSRGWAQSLPLVGWLRPR